MPSRPSHDLVIPVARTPSALRWRSGLAGLAFLVVCIGIGLTLAGEPAAVRGVVLTAEGEPAADARVRWQGGADAAMTDAQGAFTLHGVGRRVTAWKQGYFIAGQAAARGPLQLRLRPLPEQDNLDYEWVDPRPDRRHEDRCGNCHTTIHGEWAGSAHARSAGNRRFLNLYEGSDWHGRANVGWNLLAEHPLGAGVCTACHAPTASERGEREDIRKVAGVDALGVHCDFCHKIAEASTERLGLAHGRFGYELLRPTQGQLFFGPLDDVDRNEDTFAPLYKESRYCAACHEGTIFGVPVYTTYSEWLDSPARREGKHCQSCHMTPTGAMTNLAPGKGGIPRDPHTLASHAMRGATPEMLRRAVNLKVRCDASLGEVQVHVAVAAGDVGHRVPTGFIDRQLILSVEGVGQAGRQVEATSGPLLPMLAGLGENRAGLFFAKQLEDLDGQAPVPFWKPCRIRADTRLKPGEATVASWTYPAEGLAGVRIRLIYRRFPAEVQRAKAWPDDSICIIDQAVSVPTNRRLGR
jgi:hypothetical protein